MRDLGSPRRLGLPIHASVRFVLVRPHYPENLGACARAIKTMGFGELVLVRPGRLCTREHDMAFKMAVKSWDVLDSAKVVENVAEATRDVTHVVATTARRGQTGIRTLRHLARDVLTGCARGDRFAVLFGNEKTGLAEDEQAAANWLLRIPMAADQPSINLAQAVQLVAYELFATALEARDSEAAGG